ncbi:MAG: biotin/lipoyl-binding protein, partial [Proteobacteria bacterium]
MKPTYTRRLLSWRAVAFIESPSSSMLRLALLVLVGSFITCLVASFFIQLNISVTAMGVTDYLGGVKEAIAMTSGEIETLRVHEGDEVAKGQILALIRMPGISEPELRSLSKLLDEKLITLDSKKIKPDGFAKRLVDIQDVNLKSALLEAEQKQTLYLYNQKVSSAQARRELDPLKRKQKVIRQQLEFIATSAVQSYLLMQKQSLEDDAGRIEQEILAAENTIATRSYDVKADAEKSIRLAQAALNAYIIAHEVRAPVAGIVGRLTAAPGGTVKDQQIIASILPL